ncbi:Hypothetical protein PAS_chr2-1_0019 [Komagataella phaffii GS115]|uniref:Uncharacterized protein n=1 Tax=Komagataella phaffii (strain GS115 / ATCC 20864) TaxID=644223 RepID=C4QZE4_KOMPG|nr:Hypothetical protein PAS_chr2-1_0019 [Komagataella phaffii GS115]CAY68618.1 Hypothetical protein PAS_chr2-1_0019 [Komagataella phaffii GS115]
MSCCCINNLALEDVVVALKICPVISAFLGRHPHPRNSAFYRLLKEKFKVQVVAQLLGVAHSFEY